MCFWMPQLNALLNFHLDTELSSSRPSLFHPAVTPYNTGNLTGNNLQKWGQVDVSYEVFKRSTEYRVIRYQYVESGHLPWGIGCKIIDHLESVRKFGRIHFVLLIENKSVSVCYLQSDTDQLEVLWPRTWVCLIFCEPIWQHLIYQK